MFYKSEVSVLWRDLKLELSLKRALNWSCFSLTGFCTYWLLLPQDKAFFEFIPKRAVHKTIYERIYEAGWENQKSREKCELAWYRYTKRNNSQSLSRQPQAEKGGNGDRKDFADSYIFYICTLPRNICIVHLDGPVYFPVTENDNRIRQIRVKY